ncbi:phosphate acyltransferase PlsX [Poseidonocella sedimentorum]|uniref:Phosphate acyltransferase n=1 Tax=Poseidonocella sedimentorum TaxID=871652 RepID=A0A1I6DG24_9RHOB|nr:phosphate acyltransferase PlsX [Poseidonocella sedimentorum]SFR04357.1 phosphate:acyl-[acyl carrier protein] acyltransferase [Poseidonocella sedimentorum]
MTSDQHAPADQRRDRITISIDAMGGDRGPSAVVAGMARSMSKNPDIGFIVHGPQETLEPLIAKRRGLADICEIRDAKDTVRMDEKPAQVLRRSKTTSMWSALTSVKKREADVCVSCGNTGALMMLSVVRLRKLSGVDRPAIAVLWPSRSEQGYNIMLDAGADIRADEHDLVKYALMGVSYARNGLGIEHPRVGLLNVGTEEHKGRPELRLAYELIEELTVSADFRFVGFVEGGDLPRDTCDVIVTDGFSGNVALKTGEGTASLIGERLREAFRYSPLSRLASVLAYTSLQRLSKKIDPRRVNGGVFLGLNGTVVKSHGSADATGVSAAIKLAYQLTQSNFSEKLAARVASAPALDQDGETGDGSE